MASLLEQLGPQLCDKDKELWAGAGPRHEEGTESACPPRLPSVMSVWAAQAIPGGPVASEGDVAER